MSKSKKKNEWVVYPEVVLTADDIKKYSNMSDEEKKVIFTPKVEEEGRIDEFPQINPADISIPSVTEVVQTDIAKETLTAEEQIEIIEKLQEEDDLDKKTYTKITPTFYVKTIPKEEGQDEDVEFFKILNPETGDVETRELTDEEKREIIVHELKESRKVFNPINQQGNKTTNPYGSKYKQKRKRKNKLTKASRKANR